MANESTGWGGEFWLHDGSSLVQLSLVRECGMPEVTVDQLDTSHLQSTNKFKEFIGGMKEGSEFPVIMNYVPRSATDLLCEGSIGDNRAFKIVEPDFDGVGVQDITGTVLVTGYKPDPMKPNEVRTATLMCKLVGNYTKAAAA